LATDGSRGVDATATYHDTEAVGKWRWHGNPNPRLLVCGNSHRIAMLEALNQTGGRIPAAVLHQSMPGQRWEADYWDAVLEADQRLPLAIMWAGNELVVRFTFETGVPFTVAGAGEADPALPAVPEEMVLAMLADDLIPLRKFLEQLADRPRVLVGPPPPKRNEHIRHRLTSELYFKPIVERNQWTADTAPINPQPLRLRLWQLHRDALAEISRLHETPLLALPEGISDADGALRDEFSAPDMTHANATYAALVWDQLLAHFGLAVAA
jgi:hypothetical protein